MQKQVHVAVQGSLPNALIGSSMQARAKLAEMQYQRFRMNYTRSGLTFDERVRHIFSCRIIERAEREVWGSITILPRNLRARQQTKRSDVSWHTWALFPTTCINFSAILHHHVAVDSSVPSTLQGWMLFSGIVVFRGAFFDLRVKSPTAFFADFISISSATLTRKSRSPM